MLLLYIKCGNLSSGKIVAEGVSEADFRKKRVDKCSTWGYTAPRVGSRLPTIRRRACRAKPASVASGSATGE